MRFRFLSCSVATALAFAAGVSQGAPAGARASEGPRTAGSRGPVHVTRAATGAAALWDQNSDGDGNAISSQNFEASFDAFDDAAADDFRVPAGVKWKVKSVTVTGIYFNGTGPAVSETVTFYQNAGGVPGAVKTSATVTGADSSGSFVIVLPSPVGLGGGPNGKTYWVSVVANMNFNPDGQWGWETRNTKVGKGGVWQNPGNGFGTGCTTWTRKGDCGLAGGPDFMFALGGRAIPI
jgi:hypothetical protein